MSLINKMSYDKRWDEKKCDARNHKPFRAYQILINKKQMWVFIKY